MPGTGFKQEDRDLLVRLETKYEMSREETGRRFDDLEKQDEVLHKRISDLGKGVWATKEKIDKVDKRLDKIRNIFSGIALAVNSAIGGILLWLKLKSETGG